MAWLDSLVNAGVEVVTKKYTLTSNWGQFKFTTDCHHGAVR